jgi:phosphoglycerate dehydrogenase-like enzyme
MPDCLIVSAAANEYAKEIERLADFPLPVKACASSEEALEDYTDQTVLFGNPDMIAPILPEMPSIDWVQLSWAGVTPLMAIDRRDYVLTNVRDVFGPQMSEYVMGNLLAHELKVLERMKQQRKHDWFEAHSGSLQGKRLGIMGTGSIGRHIAQTATCFGIKVTGLSRSGTSSPVFENVMPVSRLHDFLKETDYLVSTLPQTDDTDDLLDGAALAQLPAHAYFINIGRSNIINDEALIDALRKNKLAGAALDVFDVEPVPQDSPLWDTPNLSITGHIAAISHPSLIVPIFVDNYRRYMQKQPLKYTIDFDAGYSAH